MTDADRLGNAFAHALAEKDAARLADLLHPEVDFRGLTPNRSWEATGPDEVLATLLGAWFEASDEIRSVDSVDTGQVADRRRVAYRFTVTNPDGRHVVEQQAYVGERDGRIDWMRVLCSGYRPAA